MEMYRIWNYEKEVLVKQNRVDGCRYHPVQDINGDWFISEVQHKHCGLGVLADFEAPERILDI